MVARADAGDAAAKDALFAALYSELHRLAQAHIRNSSGPLTLGATTLLHEAYLTSTAGTHGVPGPPALPGIRLARDARPHHRLRPPEARAEARRRDHASPILTRTTSRLPATRRSSSSSAQRSTSWRQSTRALAELVDLKFFCGFSFGEIAAMRGVSERTVQRDWAKARVLLHAALDWSQILARCGRLDTDRWQALSPLLDRALELDAARAAELRRARSRPTGRRRRPRPAARGTRSLLGSDFLESPPDIGDRPTPSLAGQTVGAYTLDVPLGRGGMGTVWLARRSDGRFEGTSRSSCSTSR